jgi:hypothetical protein
MKYSNITLLQPLLNRYCELLVTNSVTFYVFVVRASLYNLVNKTNLVHKFILRIYIYIYIYINLYMFWEPMCPSSGETSVFVTTGTCYCKIVGR